MPQHVALLAVALMLFWTGHLLAADAQPAPTARIPIIFDTDIGDDIDDTWALALILKSPELDLRLAVGDHGKAIYRAKLLAKFLQVAGRTDVPVGIGLPPADGVAGQAKWVEDYDLKSYPGKVYDDGVQAMIDMIMSSQRPITVVAVGPVPNLAEALRREPRIAQRARFVGMHGSVRKGYGGKAQIEAEYNVRSNVKACQAVFTAPWEMTITPLDTCGLVHLRGEKYARVRDSKDPVAAALIDNYRLWCGQKPERADTASSTLFDTVAVYLAFADAFCTIETLPIRVDENGFTLIDESSGKRMRVATEWKDMGAFEDLLAERISGPSPKAP